MKNGHPICWCLKFLFIAVIAERLCYAMTVSSIFSLATVMADKRYGIQNCLRFWRLTRDELVKTEGVWQIHNGVLVLVVTLSASAVCPRKPLTHCSSSPMHKSARVEVFPSACLYDAFIRKLVIREYFKACSAVRLFCMWLTMCSLVQQLTYLTLKTNQSL